MKDEFSMVVAIRHDSDHAKFDGEIMRSMVVFGRVEIFATIHSNLYGYLLM